MIHFTAARLRALTLALSVFAAVLVSPAAASAAGHASGPSHGTHDAAHGSTHDAANGQRGDRGNRVPFSLLQMNVCSSGYAGCFARTAYPKVLDEVVERVDAHHVDAVTLNEACSGDVAEIAARTGYHYRFATVIYRGAPLDCKTPTGRGVFGNAVLTKDAIRSSQDAPYSVFSGVEERRWLCVTTARRVNVCSSHLSTDGEAADSTNSVQCAELAAVLASRGPRTIFAGDVNRHASCAPEGMWTLTDAAATQAAGIQHVYGNLAAPKVTVEPAAYTDHDAVLVQARLRR
ncbi:endonuclease/exonuclease/phosphatase family protein [Streptomyces sp. NPDC002690]